MERATAGAMRLVTGVAGVFADSFRDAYVATGMNLMQSILLCTLGIGRRGWVAVRDVRQSAIDHAASRFESVEPRRRRQRRHPP
jgi:hypothetical protein